MPSKTPHTSVRLEPDNKSYVDGLEQSENSNTTQIINRLIREDRERKQTPQIPKDIPECRRRIKHNEKYQCIQTSEKGLMQIKEIPNLEICRICKLEKYNIPTSQEVKQEQQITIHDAKREETSLSKPTSDVPLETTINFIDVQTCKVFEPNPKDREYGRCRKEGFWKKIKTEKCLGCKESSIKNVPTLESISRLEQRTSKLEDKEKSLISSVKELKNVEELPSKLKFALDLIGEKNKEINNLKEENKNTHSLLENACEEVKRLNGEFPAMQEIIKERDASTSKASEMNNGLLARIEENGHLQDDNDYLRSQNEELSHDSLVENNKELTIQLEDAKQYVKVQEAQSNKDKGELKADILQLQALGVIKQQTLNDVVLKFSNLLREFKEYSQHSDLIKCEQCVEGFTFKLFIKGVQKKIEDFQGYLNTIVP